MKTITEVRNAFWQHHSEYASQRRSRKRQNQYCTDIRVAFCNFVNYLRRNEEISESLANRVTL